MPTRVLNITDGPDKPALQWALAYPEREQVHFRVGKDGVDAQITLMEELSNGFSFELKGVLQSGEHKGKPFRGSYSVESRSGALTLE